MEISKLDAAKRQLDSAVSFYFRSGDPVSAHTLVAAAHQILMDLGKKEGIESIFKGHSLKFINKEMHAEYLKAISEAENYFKHAKKDAHKLLTFNPETTDFLLFDAVEMYMQLTREQPEDMSIYRAWFLFNHPTIISDDMKKELAEKNINYMQYSRTTNKQRFYMNIKEAKLQQRIL